jgi:hypothetical protein
MIEHARIQITAFRLLSEVNLSRYPKRVSLERGNTPQLGLTTPNSADKYKTAEAFSSWANAADSGMGDFAVRTQWHLGAV